MIESYVQAVLALLDSLPFVETFDVDFEKRGEFAGFVRGKAEFNDGSSLLFFRELWDLREPIRKAMYAYHYQDKNGALIFRYDNTAHHRNISTFPRHKHLSGGGVTSADAPSLEDVLTEIETYLLQNEES